MKLVESSNFILHCRALHQPKPEFDPRSKGVDQLSDVDSHPLDQGMDGVWVLVVDPCLKCLAIATSVLPKS